MLKTPTHRNLPVHPVDYRDSDASRRIGFKNKPGDELDQLRGES